MADARHVRLPVPLSSLGLSNPMLPSFKWWPINCRSAEIESSSWMTLHSTRMPLERWASDLSKYVALKRSERLFSMSEFS